MSHFDGVRGRVFYRHWPAADPQVVYVFLHGFGEHSGLYERLASTLTPHGIDLWALDEIGHGQSDGERGLVESIGDLVANADRLVALATAARPELPVVIAGHSLGGVAAAVALGRTPQRYAGAVLSGTPLSPLPWVLELAAGGGDELALDPADLSSDPWYLDALEHDPYAFTEAPVARTLGGTLPPAWAEIADTFPASGRPVLLLHGGEDPIAPVDDARGWAERVDGVRLAEFPGARHDVLNETVHADVAAAIVEFVRGVVEAQRRPVAREAASPA